MSEIIWFFSFSDGLISLSIMFSRSIHTVARGKIFSFLWLSSIPLYKCPILVHMHSSTDGPLGCFHILVIVNNAAMNTAVLMFFQISVLGSFSYIPEVGSLGQKADPFLIFEVSPYCFSHGYTGLHFHQHCKKFPFLPILGSTCCLLIY